MNVLNMLDSIINVCLKQGLPKQITLVFDAKQRNDFEQDLKTNFGSFHFSFKTPVSDLPDTLSYGGFDFYIFSIENFE